MTRGIAVASFVAAVALALLSSLSLSLIGAGLLVLLVIVDALTHRPHVEPLHDPTKVTVDLRRRRR